MNNFIRFLIVKKKTLSLQLHMRGVRVERFTFNRTHQFPSNCKDVPTSRCFWIRFFLYQWQNWPTATDNNVRDTPTKKNSLISYYLRLQINVIVGGAARRPFFRSPFVKNLKKSKAMATFCIDYCYEEARELNSFRFAKERDENVAWKYAVFNPPIINFILYNAIY